MLFSAHDFGVEKNTQINAKNRASWGMIMLTIAAWNKSMFPPDKQPLIERDLIDAFVPKDGRAEAVGVVVEVMDIIVERRQKLFPDLRKIVVDYEVEVGGGGLTLNVTSAPIPEL